MEVLRLLSWSRLLPDLRFAALLRSSNTEFSDECSAEAAEPNPIPASADYAPQRGAAGWVYAARPASLDAIRFHAMA